MENYPIILQYYYNTLLIFVSLTIEILISIAKI